MGRGRGCPREDGMQNPGLRVQGEHPVSRPHCEAPPPWMCRGHPRPSPEPGQDQGAALGSRTEGGGRHPGGDMRVRTQRQGRGSVGDIRAPTLRTACRPQDCGQAGWKRPAHVLYAVKVTRTQRPTEKASPSSTPRRASPPGDGRALEYFQNLAEGTPFPPPGFLLISFIANGMVYSEDE